MRLFEESSAKLNRLGPLSPFMGMGNRFEPLYIAHVARIHHLVRLAGVAARDAPDIVQEVLVTLHRELSRGSLSASRPIKGWIHTTTFRKARDFLALARNRHEALASTDEDEPRSNEGPSAAPTPEDIAMRTIDVHEHVYTILRGLPDDQRLVLVMYHVEGLNMAEIAEALEIHVDTGYSRLRAAEKKFKHDWEAQRSTGAPLVLPFALWGMDDLLGAAKHATPSLPDGLEEEMLRRVASRVGLAAATTAAAASAGAFTGRQVAIGATLAALAGAGLHASVSPSPPATPKPALAGDAMMHAETSPNAAASEMPSTRAAPSFAEVAPPPSVTASAAPRATQESTESKERILLDSARAAITSGDIPGAVAALDRHARSFPRGHLARERDELRALVLSYQDGGRR